MEACWIGDTEGPEAVRVERPSTVTAGAEVLAQLGGTDDGPFGSFPLALRQRASGLLLGAVLVYRRAVDAVAFSVVTANGGDATESLVAAVRRTVLTGRRLAITRDVASDLGLLGPGVTGALVCSTKELLLDAGVRPLIGGELLEEEADILDILDLHVSWLWPQADFEDWFERRPS